jgi:F-type H+-transporting ATPase subunit b
LTLLKKIFHRLKPVPPCADKLLIAGGTDFSLCSEKGFFSNVKIACPTVRVVGICLLMAWCAWAQEGNGGAEQGDPWLVWKWANFLILAGGLGYLIRKHAPAFFQQRTKEIQQAISEATQASKDAEARVAAIELRLAGLQSEIESLRATAHAEVAAEGERIGRETEQRLQRIREQSAQEIALMSRAARFELRKYSAQLALDLAEQRIRSRMTADVQDGLVDGFVQDLHNRLTPGARI